MTTQTERELVLDIINDDFGPTIMAVAEALMSQHRATDQWVETK